MPEGIRSRGKTLKTNATGNVRQLSVAAHLRILCVVTRRAGPAIKGTAGCDCGQGIAQLGERCGRDCKVVVG